MSARLRTAEKAKQKSFPSLVGQALLQRKCACGQHTVSGGECAECRKKRLALQRRATNQAEPSAVPPIVYEVLRSPGQPLDAETRAFMEPRFGHDFSRVRAHTDAKAAESARAVNALAYTVGRDVVFGTGQFAPRTSEGKSLLAHELTHVVHQGGQFEMFGGSAVIAPSDGLAEREADQVAEAAKRTPEPSFVKYPVTQQRVVSALYRRRSPDVVYNNHHSFLIRAMLPGDRTEVRVQFYQDPSDTRRATFAVWYQETGAMQRVSFTSPGAIQPAILDERVGIVTFDLNGDGTPDIVLIAQPNHSTLGVDFSATLNGSRFFNMRTRPRARARNYVAGRGIYMGTLPNGRRYYMIPYSSQHPLGPFFVDERGEGVNPGLEFQADATLRAVGRGYLIGYAIILSIAAAYALVGVLGTTTAAGTTGTEVAIAGAGTEVAVGAGATVARTGLIAALRQAGVRFTEQAIVGITRTIAGRIVWLETGTASAGLTHIMQRHGSQFATWGLRSAQQVSQLLINTVQTLTPVATRSGGAFDFVVRVGGVERMLRIVIGSNGFIVTAHPL